jgi:hypothetical protein
MSKQTNLREWMPSEVTRMLANPYYTGIRVHADLAVPRPVYRDKFLETARTYIETTSAKIFLLEFLSLLQFPDEWARRVILVHKRFTEDHPAILTTERFIQAGDLQICDLGLETYCKYLLDNLESAG